MTLGECISEHRKMWNWIADTTEKLERPVRKYEYFDFIGCPELKVPLLSCFCCDYTQKAGKWCGGTCPLDWGNKENKCTNVADALFDGWCNACNNENWREAAVLARKIANLPERNRGDGV